MKPVKEVKEVKKEKKKKPVESTSEEEEDEEENLPLSKSVGKIVYRGILQLDCVQRSHMSAKASNFNQK